MSTMHFLRRGRRFALGEFASSVTTVTQHPLVSDWVTRVIANGGATPSTTTQNILTTFCYSLDSAGLTSMMKAVCCFVPDSLIAAITPLIKNYGNDPWTNHGPFVSGDLTVNGLVGTASSHKYLDTGVIPSTAFSSDGSLGYTLVCPSGSVESTTDMGIWSAGGTNDALYLDYGGTVYFDCHNSSNGRLSHAISSPISYWSVNRTSATTSVIFTGSASAGHFILASATGSSSIGTRATCAVFVFATNSAASPGSAVTWTNRRYSFCAIHEWFSSANSLAFFNAIQAMRTSLGGGQV